MASALKRILRFRQLAEEQSRLEVERAAQRLRQAAAACERQTATEHRQRVTLADTWKPETMDPSENRETVHENVWLLEEATLEFFGWNRMRLEEIREAESRRIQPIIETYTERRRELRQTEQLVEQQAKAEHMEKERRTQAETDTWFLERNLARQRRAQQQELASRKSKELKTRALPKIVET